MRVKKDLFLEILRLLVDLQKELPSEKPPDIHGKWHWTWKEIQGTRERLKELRQRSKRIIKQLEELL